MQRFMNFTPLNKKTVLQLAFICAFSLIVYLLASHFYYRNGFPLDDSWIHLTYARNLALHGEWAFQPGKSTAGSTAPLWTLLLAIGFLLKLGPYMWTYLLGSSIRSSCRPISRLPSMRNESILCKLNGVLWL